MSSCERDDGKVVAACTDAHIFKGELRIREFGGNVEMNNDGEEEEGAEAWYFEGELACRRW
jgi:hypothetical protein